MGSKNVENLSFEVRNVDSTHAEIILKIGSTDVNVDSMIQGRIITTTEKNMSDEFYNSLLDFLPNNWKRKSINLQTGKEFYLTFYY